MKALITVVFLMASQFALAEPVRVPANLKQALIAAVDQQQAQKPELLAALHSPTTEIRAAAVRALGQILKPASLDVLLPMMTDSEPMVEKELCFALGQLGKYPAFSDDRRDLIAEKLSVFLADSNDDVLKTCTEAFGKAMSEANQNNLLYVFQNHNEAVIQELIYGIYQGVLTKADIAPSQPAFVLSPEIKAAFKAAHFEHHSSYKVRKAIAYIASTFKDSEGARIATELSHDRSPEVRTAAARSLARLDVPAETLAAMLSDHNDQVVTEALTGLSRKKAYTLVPQSLLHHGSFHVRSLALNLLAQQTEIKIDFKPWLNDLSQTVRYEAAKALLSKENPQMETEAKNFLESSEARLREALAEMAGNSVKAETLLLALMDDEDSAVQTAALSTAGGIASRNLLDAMKQYLTSPAVRWVAVDTLATSDFEGSYQVLVDSYATMLEPQSEPDRLNLLNYFLAEKTSRGTQSLYSFLGLETSPKLFNRIVSELASRGETGLPSLKPEVLRSSPHIGRTFTRNPIAIFATVHGEIRMELFPEVAPTHVADLVGQIEGGKYQAALWHRVVSNFVIQSSNPRLQLEELPDYSLRAEINPIKYERGTVGMPRGMDFDSGSGPGIFINHMATPFLDGDYTVFGKVISDMNVVDQIEVGDEILSARVQY